jgi:hypothetical protein
MQLECFSIFEACVERDVHFDLLAEAYMKCGFLIRSTWFSFSESHFCVCKCTYYHTPAYKGLS